MLIEVLRRAVCTLIGVFGIASIAIAQAQVIIQGGTLVNVRDGTLNPNTTIVINGDRIASVSIGGTSEVAGATVVDASGKYILPGLIDPHLHYKDWSPELFLNHGVTSVLD